MREKVIRTERLNLRPFRAGDVDDVFDIYSGTEVARWLQRPAMTEMSGAAEALARFQSRNERLEWPNGLYAIELTATGKVVGTGLLQPLPSDEKGRVEVGWHLAESAWGNGFATEAGKAMIQAHFEQTQQDAIYAIIMPENVNSRAVAGRLSLLDIREWFSHPIGLELMLFRQTRSEWESAL
ncbi:MAG: GNAT family N-acetyltransferase [Planctomycetota bacterium]|jgi:RimJ/RimL family protein N-acetyltransferase